MSPTLHAWDCPCGTRNAAQLTECRKCRGSQVRGKPIYAGAMPAPPVAPITSVPASPPRREIPLNWLVGAFILLLVLVVFPQMGRKNQENTTPRMQTAMKVYQAEVQSVADVAPGVFLSTFILEGEPNVTLSDEWYKAPRYLKERLVDGMGGRWKRCAQAVGLEPAPLLNFRDVGGRSVAVYRPLGGTQILRE